VSILDSLWDINYLNSGTYRSYVDVLKSFNLHYPNSWDTLYLDALYLLKKNYPHHVDMSELDILVYRYYFFKYKIYCIKLELLHYESKEVKSS